MSKNRKSKKSQGFGNRRFSSINKNRNMEAVDKHNNGDPFAIMKLAMQYELEETLRSGNYFPSNFWNE